MINIISSIAIGIVIIWLGFKFIKGFIIPIIAIVAIALIIFNSL